MFQLRFFSSITSHREWLKRHVRDPYVKLSCIEGMRSRAAYKLQEIDQKFNLIKTKPGFSIVSQELIDCLPALFRWTAVVLLEDGQLIAVGNCRYGIVRTCITGQLLELTC